MITRYVELSADLESQCDAPLDRLPEQIALQRLAESPYTCLRHLRCEFHAGILTLHGRLPSFFMMQVAQAIAVGVEGVEQVSANIEVPYVAGARFD